MADQKDRQQHAGISHHLHQPLEAGQRLVVQVMRLVDHQYDRALALAHDVAQVALRSEEHTSELQSLMRISYAVFCLKKKKNEQNQRHHSHYSITKSK